MGIGYHVSITLVMWVLKLVFLCFLFSWKTFLLTTHFNFFVLNFKLGVQANYPLAWMFVFHTLAAAFPASYRWNLFVLVEFEKSALKTQQWCMHFILQSALLDCIFPFLILVCYIRLVYCMSNFQIVSIALPSLVKDTFSLQLC